MRSPTHHSAPRSPSALADLLCAGGHHFDDRQLRARRGRSLPPCANPDGQPCDDYDDALAIGVEAPKLVLLPIKQHQHVLIVMTVARGAERCEKAALNGAGAFGLAGPTGRRDWAKAQDFARLRHRRKPGITTVEARGAGVLK